MKSSKKLDSTVHPAMFQSYASSGVHPTDYPLYELIYDVINDIVELSEFEDLPEEIMRALWPILAYFIDKLDKNLSVPSERLVWR